MAIPGTTWTRVTTNEGNVFYFEKETKRSEWSVPEDIREDVAALEAEEQAKRQQVEKEDREQTEKERLERLKEMERVRLEVMEDRKRQAVKRKEREENGEAGEPDAKVAKQEEGDGEFGPQNEEDEEAWMKAVAAEFADADKAVEAEKVRDKAAVEREEEEAAKKVFSVPEKVNVTLEEGRALFKVGSSRPCQASR